MKEQQKIIKLIVLLNLILIISINGFQYENLTLTASPGRYFNIHSYELRIKVHKDPFYIEIFENMTQKLLYSTKSVDLLVGNWAGFSFQKYIYEGYSFRLGLIYEKFKISHIAQATQPSPQSVLFLLKSMFVGADDIFFEISKVDQRRLSLNLYTEKHGIKSFNRILWGFDSHKDEGLYGFGERFVPEQNKKGHAFYDWVEDGGFSLGTNLRLPKGAFSTYIPIPFALSSDGYGIFLNTTYRTEWNLKDDRVHYTVESNSSELNLYFGQTPADSLIWYLSEIGTTLIPPKWAFGLWEQFNGEMGNATVEEWPHDKAVTVWRKFIELDIPASIHKEELHFFPHGSQRGQEEHIKNVTSAFSDLGMLSTAYFNPMIATDYTTLYNEALEKGYFVKKSNGEVAKFYYKGAGPNPFYVSMLDYSNPEVVTFWEKQIQEAIDLGFKGWMQDYGEYVDPDHRFYNGWDGDKMHNEYVNMYHCATTDYLKAKEPEAVKQGYAPQYSVYVRSGYSKTQTNVWSVWTGDGSSDFTPNAGLPAQLSAMLSAGIVGIPYIGSDIGGFVWFKPPTLELLIRWGQVGLMSGTMEIDNGGTNMLKYPKSHFFEWGDGVTSLRLLAKMRMQLFPYIYTMAHYSNSLGFPLMRHHIINFPYDKEALKQNYQYMFGDSLLTAPVVEEGKTVQKVYLPVNHEWFDLTNNVIFDQKDGRFRLKWSPYYTKGGSYVEVNAQLINSLPPILIRAGSIIPIQDPTVQSIYDSVNKTVVCQKDRAYIQHYWAFPENKTCVGYGKSYDSVHFETLCLTSQFIWNITDSLNRLYTVQIVLTTLPKSKQLTIIDNKQRKIGSATNLSQIVDLQLGEKDQWLYFYDESVNILWLRYSGCSASMLTDLQCNSFAIIKDYVVSE